MEGGWLVVGGTLCAPPSVLRDTPARSYLAWLQRFRYLRLLLERRVNVLAVDSDVALLVDPYPLLRASPLNGE